MIKLFIYSAVIHSAIFLNYCVSQELIDSESIQYDNSDLIESGSFKYVSLSDTRIYDVEIIVFAYISPLPNVKTYTNKTVSESNDAIELDLKPDQLPYTRYNQPVNDESVDSTKVPEKNSMDYTIPIEEDDDNMEILVWFELPSDKYKLTPIFERISQQSKMIPLVHKAWRQTETPFENPVYIRLNNYYKDPLQSASEPDSSLENIISSQDDQYFFTPINTEIIKNTANPETYAIDMNKILEYDNGYPISTGNKIYSDFTVDGKVALSQGRFMHFQNQLDLFRLESDPGDNTIRNMIFKLDERRQIQTDELYYFDSPWIGSIVKVTEYIPEIPENEIIDEPETSDIIQ